MLQLQPTNLRRMPCAFGASAKRPLRVGLVPRTPRRNARDQSACRCSLQHDKPAPLLQRLREGALQAGLPLLGSLLLACGPAVAAETLQGVARAVDGDTLEVRTQASSRVPSRLPCTCRLLGHGSWVLCER